MPERFDVVILGAGPAGEVAVNVLVNAEKRVAVVEPELIGGECTNWGCIPSKTLLRPPDLKGESRRAQATGEPALDWPALARYRNWMVSDHDDTKRVANLEKRGVRVFKDAGRLAGPGRVEVGGQTLEADAVIVATGGEPIIPPLPGLAEAGYWTNREATALDGDPAQRRVHRRRRRRRRALPVPRPLRLQGDDRRADRWPRARTRASARSSPRCCARTASSSGSARVGSRCASRAASGSSRSTMARRLRGEVVVVATGRRPRTHDLGLETVGIEPGRRGPRRR